MSRKKEVQLRKGNTVVSVMPTTVKRYERDGWTVVEDGSSEAAQNVEPVPVLQVDAVPAKNRSGADPAKDKE